MRAEQGLSEAPYDPTIRTPRRKPGVNGPERLVVEISVRSWVDRANCRGIDSQLFYPDRGEPTRQAKEVCRGCEVRDDCLDYALTSGQKFGIWGGTSERERRSLRSRRLREGAAGS